jgi:2-succinyl-5-enolpyruvyl-6-hydroxy-3-cyclohexene-1-carboxylate synthase
MGSAPWLPSWPGRRYHPDPVGLSPSALWATAFFDALATAGVRHVCVSPGSRSAPLTLAVANQPGLTTSVHIDERSAAFFALGYGRATGVPAALVCTSGTAAGNYLPAVIEAHYSRVPLVVLTADRPPELRDTGAWQAIDQIKLYGSYVRWFAEVATPDAAPDMLRYVRHVAGRAVAAARGRPAGPVHLNLPFREPLVDEQTRNAAAALHALLGEVGQPPAVAPTHAVVADDVLADLAARIRAEPQGLILCGTADPPPGYAGAIARLAAATGYPVLAEPASGVRYGPHDRSQVITGYDAFLRDPSWCSATVPGLVLRFGASLTWKQVAAYLARHPAAYQVLVDPDGTWDDPTRLAAVRLPAEPVPLCDALAHRVAEGSCQRVSDRAAWRGHWLAAAEHARGARAAALATDGVGTVGWLYEALLAALPDGAVLYAANSMAVRDLDTFSDTMPTVLRVIANRGAAGIDGTISSALGAAYGSGAPTVLVTGDLAFLHDLNGLGAAHLPGVNATIIVLNDEGGGIFEYLPVAELAPEAFEHFFVTPPGADLAAGCATYRVSHVVVADAGAFARHLTASLGAPGVQVIEVPVDRAANTAAHRRYWAAVAGT